MTYFEYYVIYYSYIQHHQIKQVTEIQINKSLLFIQIIKINTVKMWWNEHKWQYTKNTWKYTKKKELKHVICDWNYVSVGVHMHTGLSEN